MPVTKILIPALDESGAAKLTAASEPVYREVFLGRRAPRTDKKTLRFAKYYDPVKDAAPPPASMDWFTKAAASLQRMYLNDQLGDCVIASKYHQVGVHTGNESGTAAVGSDAEVQAQYEGICGPGDNGCVITDVLDAMKAKGLPLSGVTHKIDGYVSVDWTNKTEVMVALDLFGALCIGINLPSAWADGAKPGGTWDVTNTGIVGGHDVCCVGYNSTGVQISTWGMTPPITITWAAFTSKSWIEECYAMLSPDWYASGKLAPNGVDAATLAADLAALGGGTVPPIPDPVPPPVPPVPPIPPTPASGFSGTLTYALGVLTDVTPGTGPAATLTDALAAAFADPRVLSALKSKVAARAPVPGIFVKILAAVIPVVLADLAAGKTPKQMIPDIVAAILAALA